MSVEAILIAALCVAVPVTLKYILSFEIGQQMAMLKAGEREVTGLSNRLAALKQEHGIVRRAASQVLNQRRWADTRRALMEEELGQWREIACNNGNGRSYEPNESAFEPSRSAFALAEWETLASGQ